MFCLHKPISRFLLCIPPAPPAVSGGCRHLAARRARKVLKEVDVLLASCHFMGHLLQHSKQHLSDATRDDKIPMK
ncbi:hypothetical protein E2C01_029425 [Portunus trituberculatus]|uniref:Uncharacterized protein n=1 Tax=Portunus trituberculatus TaxID=210409 RepID=A0A5B7ERX5_PORTR|nr:hypothetical protein [Portunus trituberculatus]